MCAQPNLSADSVAQIWNKKGLSLRKNGKLAESIECYDRALEVDPNSAAAWSNKARALDELNKLPDAMKCYKKALQLNPNSASTWNNQGYAYRKQKRYDTALECYDRAIALRPNYDKAWFNKGYILEQQGRYKEALECFDKAISFTPDNAKYVRSRDVVLQTYKQIKHKQMLEKEQLLLQQQLQQKIEQPAPIAGGRSTPNVLRSPVSDRSRSPVEDLDGTDHGDSVTRSLEDELRAHYEQSMVNKYSAQHFGRDRDGMYFDEEGALADSEQALQSSSSSGKHLRTSDPRDRQSSRDSTSPPPNPSDAPAPRPYDGPFQPNRSPTQSSADLQPHAVLPGGNSNNSNPSSSSRHRDRGESSQASSQSSSTISRASREPSREPRTADNERTTSSHEPREKEGRTRDRSERNHGHNHESSSNRHSDNSSGGHDTPTGSEEGWLSPHKFNRQKSSGELGGSHVATAEALRKRLESYASSRPSDDRERESREREPSIRASIDRERHTSVRGSDERERDRERYDREKDSSAPSSSSSRPSGERDRYSARPSVEERDRPEQPPSRGDIVSPRVTSLDESMLLFPDTYRVLLELEDRLESISTMEELNYLEQGVEEIAPAIQAKKSVLQRKKEDEEAKCTVCLDSPPTMICIPCGHFCLCEPCSKKLPRRRCPICNQSVKNIYKVFRA